MKRLLLGSLLLTVVSLVACVESGLEEEVASDDRASIPIAEASDAEASHASASEELPRTRILSETRRALYEMEDAAFDYDAFINWLPDYFGALYEDGNELLVFVDDLCVSAGDGEEGVVTLIVTYHDASAAITGRNAQNCVGGGNLFFTYSRESGADFAEQLFPGDTRLEDRIAPIGNDFSTYTPTVDENGRVQLYCADLPILATPGIYQNRLNGTADSMCVWMDGESIVLLLNQYEILDNGEISCPVMVYASQDGGASWSATSLDYTPVTTLTIFPVTNLVLNMRDAQNGTAILGTNRTEVFFYVTEDGGASWEKRRSFKLLHYQNQALYEGGMLTDTLGFISFIPREEKNPNVYITYDGGKNWDLMDITLPEGISDAEAYSERAFLEDGRIVLPIYVNETAVLFYVSEDEGKTWEWRDWLD